MVDPRTLLAQPIDWQNTRESPFLWRAHYRHHLLELYSGEWPVENPYTLWVDGEPAVDLGAPLPEAWTFPESSGKLRLGYGWLLSRRLEWKKTDSTQAFPWAQHIGSHILELAPAKDAPSCHTVYFDGTAVLSLRRLPETWTVPAYRPGERQPERSPYDSLLSTRLEWEQTDDSLFPWSTTHEGRRLELFGWRPDVVRTLYVSGKPALNLSGAPDCWLVPPYERD
jgi:hypothetical protein